MIKEGHPSNYIPSLDGFRAISILIVFLGHSFKNLPIPGGLGVTIFFFISGYLITTLIIREVKKSGTLNFKEFYIRRLLRLMPPLLITMVLGCIMVLLGWAEGTLDPFALISQLLFFYNYWDQNHINDGVSGLGILWSLSVEEHFYLIFPAILLFVMRMKRDVWWIVAAAISILIWRTAKFLLFDASEWEIYSLTDTRIDSIIWGCFLAVGLSAPRAILSESFRKIHLFSFIAGLLVIAMTLIVRDEIFRSTIRYTIQGVALIPVFFYSIKTRNSFVYKLLNSAWLSKIGVYSYSFYLCHYIILNALNYNEIFGNVTFTAIAAGSLSLVYAAAINQYVELPIKRWRHRIQTAALPSNAAQASGKP